MNPREALEFLRILARCDHHDGRGSWCTRCGATRAHDGGWVVPAVALALQGLDARGLLGDPAGEGEGRDSASEIVKRVISGT
jgi:hypothetical protein